MKNSRFFPLFFLSLLISSCNVWENHLLGEIESNLLDGKISTGAALERLYDFRERFPENGAAETMIASIYLDREEYHKLPEQLERATEKNAPPFQIYALEARIHALREDWELAAQSYAKAFSYDANQGLALYYAAWANLNAGFYEPAYHYAQQAFRELGEAPAAASLALNIAILLGKDEQEKRKWLEAAEESPDYLEVKEAFLDSLQTN